MANLLYNWNFTSDSYNSNVLNSTINDSKNNLVSQVLSRNTITTSTVTQDEDGITLNNTDSTGGIYIDLSGLDTVNLGGNITIEMVVKNTDNTQETVYFQTIREYIDTDNNNLDDNLNIASSGFNDHSAFLKLMYKKNETRMQVRTDSQYNSTAKDNSKVNYFLKSATSGTTLNDVLFHHYLAVIKYNSSNNKSIQLYIDGVEKGSTTADLGKELSDAVRQFNAIGSQKNPENATYLKGTVKYLKIYDNAMTETEVETTYNNYNSAPYWSDISSKTNIEKYRRRHENVNTYFTENSSVTSFTTQGNQLGLLNSNETYTIHKFINQEELNISEGYHYIPLSGINNFVILKNGSTWYKITQTSEDISLNTTYKYEISTNSGVNYGTAVTDKKFGDNFTDENITIGFGGIESGASIVTGNICFLGESLVYTDQGKIPIKDITTKNTIFGLKVISLVKVKNRDNFMILFKKDSLGINSPSIDTYVSKNHKIFINNKFIHAISLVNGKNIIKKIRGQDIIYNILFEKYYIMIVNNMIVETLHPTNNYIKK